ncbi:MAG: ribonuclease P protein component [Patescibacteria group bacterium]
MLPNKVRLKKEKDFKRVLGSKNGGFSSDFTLKKAPNGLSFSRFGFLISAKVSSKAVERNRLKRQVAALVAGRQKEIKAGWDVVLIFRKTLIKQKGRQIGEKIRELFKKNQLDA